MLDGVNEFLPSPLDRVRIGLTGFEDDDLLKDTSNEESNASKKEIRKAKKKAKKNKKNKNIKFHDVPGERAKRASLVTESVTEEIATKLSRTFFARRSSLRRRPQLERAACARLQGDSPPDSWRRRGKTGGFRSSFFRGNHRWDES